MDHNSSDYYRRRELRERTLADAAINPAIAAIHREMAEQYRARVDPAGVPPRG